MKFPFSIVLVLIIVAIIGTVAINLDVNYNTLEKSEYISPENGTIKMNTNLYYVYDNALRRETRSITIADSNYGKAIIEAMAQGSNNSYFRSFFDFGVQVNSVELINETCYVNLYDTSQLNLLLNNPDLKLYIWSVVNSLTENNNIKAVQFLVEGKQYNRSLDGYNLNAPLSKKEDFIYAKEVTSSDVVVEFLEYISTLRYDLAYSLLTKNSMNNYDYSAFIKYANNFNESHKGYNRDTYYSRIYQNYDEVFVKFTKQYETDGFMLNTYDRWTVIVEEDVYKISLNSN